jgi:hypothetical protein
MVDLSMAMLNNQMVYNEESDISRETPPNVKNPMP